MPNKQTDLDALRHSAAHLLAAAVLEMRPDAKPTIGPSIDDGFYYDFDFGSNPLSSEDLPQLEELMKKIVAKWKSFERIEVSEQDALKHYVNNPYKQELITEFTQEGQPISLYKSGDFVDLCRGGHIESPVKQLKYFKLLSIAGAYWRGNEKNSMLTRIYGTAFASQSELDKHLHLIEEAKKRDHKVLGPMLDLFTFSDKVGSGLPLWTPKGTLIRNILNDFVWELRKKRGYQQVEIPHITKKDLYEVSGHWDKFTNELFKITTREGHQFAMKPMNCPHHTQIYARKQHSYRELPQRYANTTMVYRDEQTGELSGLTRVRAITQDDAHVFLRKDQIEAEVEKIWDIIDEFYQAVGFDLYVRLSLSDPAEPEKYLGDRSTWDEAESLLRKVAANRNQKVVEALGEAAFYGPKLDFMAKDALNREWQVATNQLDLNMPVRFGLHCINEIGEKEQIYMLHAAIMGAIERYLAIIIEHFTGAFPLWLSPVQAVIIPVSDKQLEYARSVQSKLDQASLRVELWDTADSIAKKIRLAEKQKTPFMLIVGDKEIKAHTLSVRTRGEKEYGAINVANFIKSTKQLIDGKSLNLDLK
jgi:threonyl-tRNA synthetase